MKKILFVFFSTILAFATGVFIYLGGYRSVEVSVGELGPYRMIYRENHGPYHQIVPVIEAVETWARANGEPCRYSFGEYLSDPNTVAEDRLRSHAGCIVDKEWSQKDLPEGFLYRETAKRLYVHALFDGAPSIGPLKVYPRAREHLKEQDLAEDGPVIEIYEVLPEEKVRTQYLFPARVAN